MPLLLLLIVISPSIVTLSAAPTEPRGIICCTYLPCRPHLPILPPLHLHMLPSYYLYKTNCSPFLPLQPLHNQLQPLVALVASTSHLYGLFQAICSHLLIYWAICNYSNCWSTIFDGMMWPGLQLSVSFMFFWSTWFFPTTSVCFFAHSWLRIRIVMILWLQISYKVNRYLLLKKSMMCSSVFTPPSLRIYQNSIE